MAQAIVQSSCRKLRSAIEDSVIRRLNLTGDLKEMLEVLLAIDAAIPNAKDWWMLTDWDRAVSTQDDRGREDDQERGEVWLITVKDVSYMVCDMVDDLQAKTMPAAGNKMAKMLARPDSVVVESKMLDKMKEIKEKLKGLRKESVRFVDAAGRRALLQAPPAIVGRDEDVRKILDRLSIFSEGPIILLIGGDKQIGKGAMAAAVFHNDRFKSYSRIWIDIKKTNNFGLYDIGRCMDSQLVSDGEEENRKKCLNELLNGKKVLVVLRKLHEDASKWKGLKDILTQKHINITQMIIIATVDTSSDDFLKVATGTFGIEPYHLEPLSEETCCKIIKQTALRSQDTTYKEELGRIAPKVAKLCRSVPMAAQILGSLLQFKQYREWPELLDLDAPSHRSPAHTSLELSYRSMPPNLRLCFSYCAFVFATQGKIVKEDLIHQWIALHLIEPSEAFSTSQLAEQYIRRLLDMSLLQTANSIRTSANNDVCEISFTMHASVVSFEISSTRKDFCLLEAGTTPRNTENCSYISVPNLNFEGELKSIFPVQKIRVLRCLGCSKMKLRDDSFSFATYLCVLELHWSYERKLPDSICQLRHLGYLKISGWSGLVTLPESIGNLTNLLHIDLSACSQLVNLPGSLGNLIKLVHISLSGCSKLANLPESFGNLIKLVHINLSGCGLIRLPECVSKLINLVHVNLSGCLVLVKLPGSFVKLTKLEHINLSGCPKLVNLPECFGKLANLLNVNLSGCSGLVNLPNSFGKLTNLAHINLSGCPELEELPESFGKLRSLLHINLSGCSGLATLPGSFGDLQNLLHINLSRCCGLLNLPRSFGKLKKLVHLDLSFWSCFEGTRTALSGLTSLEHLDLSHPCCGLADYHHFQGLKEVLSQFIRLRHLNLSMFLNPIFSNQPEKRNLKYIDFISGFSRLEYLDLSHSIFLIELPEGLDFLGKLHTLDLSACIRLKKVGEWMAHKPSLKLVVLSNLQSYQFIVGKNNPINSYAQLVGVSCKALEISCLHMIKSAEEARILKLSERRDLQKLKLCWDMSSGRSVEDYFVLEQLVPSRSVMYLELHGYSSTRFPYWLTSSRTFSFNLVEVTMEDMPKCSDLPPLGLLLNLRSVSLKRMDSITRIDASELSGGNKAAFKQLSRFIIHDMGGLQEFTYYSRGGGRGRRSGGELLFPVIDELVVHNCPNMSFVPLPPRSQRLVISDCNVVMVCWQNRAGTNGVEGPSCISSPVTKVTELVVENCRVYLSHWCLLNHLPGLRSLTIKNCDNLVCSPEIVGVLSSLQTLCFSNCHRMSILPEHLGGLSSLLKLRIENCSQFLRLPDSMKCLTSLESLHFSDCNSMKELRPWIGSLTSLQQLAIERCTSIGDLPESIGELSNLKDLHILGCDDLKKWCGQEEGKKFLGDIQPNFEETATIDQVLEKEEDDLHQSD